MMPKQEAFDWINDNWDNYVCVCCGGAHAHKSCPKGCACQDQSCF